MAASLGICNVHTDVDACDSTPGLHWKLTGRKKSLPHRGLELAVSVLRLDFQSDALPTELSPSLLILTLVDHLSRRSVQWNYASLPEGCRHTSLHHLELTLEAAV